MILRRLAMSLIRGYRLFISPLMGPHCRFYPTCSSYAEQAVEEHGALRGMALSLRRLARCHPLHPGGYDPVPPATTPPRHLNQQPPSSGQ